MKISRCSTFRLCLESFFLLLYNDLLMNLNKNIHYNDLLNGEVYLTYTVR